MSLSCVVACPVPSCSDLLTGLHKWTLDLSCRSPHLQDGLQACVIGSTIFCCSQMDFLDEPCIWLIVLLSLGLPVKPATVTTVVLVRCCGTVPWSVRALSCLCCSHPRLLAPLSLWNSLILAAPWHQQPKETLSNKSEWRLGARQRDRNNSFPKKARRELMHNKGNTHSLQRLNNFLPVLWQLCLVVRFFCLGLPTFLSKRDFSHKTQILRGMSNY